ncbi:hypothetical protein KC19_VG277800 [Ceratodon purpureus]|uniref:Uncharacterized protein n=1 Tax=Ceratodon purpureus TaxID=3225 RepID=A0A8T0HW19_CERPU|nr:hypothetical protein KC19_VG277800 [Ceratodon purpureus]
MYRTDGIPASFMGGQYSLGYQDGNMRCAVECILGTNVLQVLSEEGYTVDCGDCKLPELEHCDDDILHPEPPFTADGVSTTGVQDDHGSQSPEMYNEEIDLFAGRVALLFLAISSSDVVLDRRSIFEAKIDIIVHVLTHAGELSR